MEALVKRKLSIDEFHRMVDAEIILENERVELIYGEIVEMSPIGDRQLAIVGRIIMLLAPLLAGRYIVMPGPVKIGNYSEPEPDLMIVPHRDDHYADTGVYPKDVRVLIEVSDSSFNKDINIKIPLYAEAGIPEVWNIDVNSEQVLQFSGLVDQAYKQQHRFGRDDTLSASTLSLEVKVKDLIG